MLNGMFKDDTYKIWYLRFNEKGELISYGAVAKEYKREGNAIRAAKKLFGDSNEFKWCVSKNNELHNLKVTKPAVK